MVPFRNRADARGARELPSRRKIQVLNAGVDDIALTKTPHAVKSQTFLHSDKSKKNISFSNVVIKAEINCEAMNMAHYTRTSFLG